MAGCSHLWQVISNNVLFAACCRYVNMLFMTSHYLWQVVVICGRWLLFVIICGRWLLFVAGGCYLLQVAVICGRWLLFVACGCYLWQVVVICGRWLLFMAGGCSKLMVP